jgi:hypothetical protein
MRRLAAFLLLAALAGSAAAHHAPGHDEPGLETIVTPLWVGPAFSGSWYSTDRSGEGFILQVLDNGTALLLWFTYPPAGSAASQAWIYADGGAIDGDRIRFTNAITTRGGRFGVTSGGVQVQRIPWGTVEFRFTSCSAGEVTFTGPAGWGSGTRQIVRLTELAELGCSGRTRITASGARAIEGLRQRSGAWYKRRQRRRRLGHRGAAGRRRPSSIGSRTMPPVSRPGPTARRRAPAIACRWRTTARWARASALASTPRG